MVAIATDYDRSWHQVREPTSGHEVWDIHHGGGNCDMDRLCRGCAGDHPTYLCGEVLVSDGDGPTQGKGSSDLGAIEEPLVREVVDEATVLRCLFECIVFLIR